MDMTILYGVGMFTAIVLALVMVILAARSRLVSSGNVSIQINGEKNDRGARWRQTSADPRRRQPVFGECLRWRRYLCTVQVSGQ